jgi:hypothetical protein
MPRLLPGCTTPHPIVGSSNLNQDKEDIVKNIDMQVKDGKLVIVVDLSKEFGPSSSGKSIIIASSEGNVSVLGNADVKIGLNVYKKA